MNNTLMSLTVTTDREGWQLNAFLAFGLARREDVTKLRAVGLNMVSDFAHTPTGRVVISGEISGH